MSKNNRLLLKGIVVSILFILPAIHFTVYCDSAGDWFVWYFYVFVSQGIIWYNVNTNWVVPYTLSLEDLGKLLARHTNLFKDERVKFLDIVKKRMDEAKEGKPYV
jgi:hypothetical protein